MHPDRKRIEELRRLALAADVETTTDPVELMRRGMEIMSNPEQVLICGTPSPEGVLCSYLQDHLGGHSWNPGTDERSELADDDRRRITETYAQYRDAMAVAAFVPWRVGRTNACNVYAVTGIAANWKDDAPIACFTTPELAIQSCDDHNRHLDESRVRR